MPHSMRWALLQVRTEEAEVVRSSAREVPCRVETLLLEREEQLEGIAAGGVEVIIASHRPPEADAMRWLPDIVRQPGRPTVVILADGDDPVSCRRLRRAGAFSVVRRDRPSRLSKAVRRAAERATWEATREDLRQLSNLMQAVGHNLRDVLGGISNAVEVLSFQAGNGGLGQRRTIELLDQLCRRMTGLLDDYSEVARIDSEPISPTREVVELGAALDRAADRAKVELGDSSSRFVRAALPGPIWMHIDARRLEHLVRHALIYVRKGKQRGSEVRIDYREAGDRFELRFDAEDRGGVPRPAVAPGIDLDLFLSRKLADRLGGRVRTGPPFVVDLPLSLVRRSGLVVPEVSRANGMDLGDLNRHALLVDDNPESVQALGLLIGRLGWNVRVTPDTTEALRMVKDFRPGVVLIDLQMPVMDGQTLAREIRREQRGPAPLLIGITGTADRPVQDESGGNCFDYFLTKPVRREQIIALLPGPAGAASDENRRR
ncbi:hybrid sensor histidine kinase/response regulator [Tautonia sociabilis]|uniref:Response regulator n=1 Tax=Tautonia sociabilis TaxID=2080755 RepID=A0A432MDX7_9BACT|nr:response regulator [Tautonia sociabilis]RUL83300.1 response regulator [Tautonia sociabilis]